MDFEIHFCWVSFFIFVVVSIIDLEYLENNMLKNKIKKIKQCHKISIYHL
jgi:hypothetical protein